MSGLEYKMLSPVDILNITFEHNKRKALICQSQDPTLSKDSSSSSSCKNKAKIFEEIDFAAVHQEKSESDIKS